MTLTGRDAEQVALVEHYAKRQECGVMRAMNLSSPAVLRWT